jgi:hypothetical protein
MKMGLTYKETFPEQKLNKPEERPVKLEFGAKGYLNNQGFRGVACTTGGSAIGASLGYIIQGASGAIKGAAIGGGTGFVLWLLVEVAFGNTKTVK